MAIVSCGRLSKGSVLEQTDEILSNTRRYRGYLQDLRRAAGRNNLVELANAARAVRSPRQRRHAEVEGLGTETAGAWWPDVPLKEEIVRQGFIKAYEVALADEKRVKPISVLWLTPDGGQQPRRAVKKGRARRQTPGRSANDFEVIVTSTDRSVTVFLVTPDPPRVRCRAGKAENIWMVASKSRVGRIAGSYTNVEDIRSGIKTKRGVSTFRLRRGLEM